MIHLWLKDNIEQVCDNLLIVSLAQMEFYQDSQIAYCKLSL